MKCFYHPYADAVGQCSNCQKGICTLCAMHIDAEYGTGCPGCLIEDGLREIPRVRRRLVMLWVFTGVVTIIGTIATISSYGAVGILFAPLIFAAAWCFYWGWFPFWGWIRGRGFSVAYVSSGGGDPAGTILRLILIGLFIEVLIFVIMGIGLFTGIQKYLKNKRYIPFAEHMIAEMYAIIGEPSPIPAVQDSGQRSESSQWTSASQRTTSPHIDYHREQTQQETAQAQMRSTFTHPASTVGTEKKGRFLAYGGVTGLIAFVVIAVLVSGVFRQQTTPSSSSPSSASVPSTGSSSSSNASATTVTVQANQGWQDSGVSIQTGNQVTIQYVSGLWTSDPAVSPFDGKGRPDGYTCANYEPASQCAEVVPDAVQGSLVGMIGTETLKIGNALTFTVTQAGSLLLRINDGNGTALDDNQGSITVQIEKS